ncbi:ATP-binding response regulator [Hufsiella ginkgonis]|uniref:histidine kinase n=1 Tax=Hufsiella ginkgonis TaxID=2695274 RepID=A0A7K1XYW0_9SPHI|nr:response regulator [Hufsiella ginkgonis]MXV15746.1 response regulator [Hufsiella ginkgonis]
MEPINDLSTDGLKQEIAGLKTRLSALQEELNASRETMKRLASGKSAFLVNISHEVRTPMNAILGMSRQLEKTRMDSQQRFYLKTLMSATRRLIQTVNGLMDIDTGTPRPEADKTILRNCRILLAEDNEMNRLVVAEMLENYQARLTEVSNGKEAVDELSRTPYDLVLMDLQMPVMDGLEATNVIRRDMKLQVPIIALTANANKGERERCMGIGMNDFVAKPFEEDDLVNTIAACLHQQVPENKPLKAEVDPVPGNTPLYNLSKLEKISQGSDVFVDKMVGLFLTQMPQSVAEIRAAYEAGNIKAIAAVAHKIKPAIDSLEIASLRQVVRELETLANTEPASQKIPRLVDTVGDVIGKVSVQLQNRQK